MDFFRPDAANAASQLFEVVCRYDLASEVDGDTARIAEQNGIAGNSSDVVEPIDLVAGTANQFLDGLELLPQFRRRQNPRYGLVCWIEPILPDRSRPGSRDFLHARQGTGALHD